MRTDHATTTVTTSTVGDFSGRKGIAYDWRSVVAEIEASRLDSELAGLSVGVPA